MGRDEPAVVPGGSAIPARRGQGVGGKNSSGVLLLGQLACMWLGRGVRYPTSPFLSRGY